MPAFNTDFIFFYILPKALSGLGEFSPLFMGLWVGFFLRQR